MKISEYIAYFLKTNGITTVFELQGGMITRLIDAINKVGDINIVSMHHEQAAAMAADAFGRILNKPGVALATSGPGATNLLTGIGNCYFDSVPAIFITGQVNLNEQKGEKATRQIGFQETDIVTMAKPVTKFSYSIESPDEIQQVLEKAYKISLSGRPGPVLIDIPMDIQDIEYNFSPIEAIKFQSSINKSSINHFFQTFLEQLKISKRPLILVGRGIRCSNSVDLLLEFISKYQIPVVLSLLGLDAIPYSHNLRIGFIGTYGNRWANYALGSCDLLLVLGSRLDLRQTGSDTKSFQKGKKIFHVDIDEAELNNRITNCYVLNENLHNFLSYSNKIKLNFETTSSWLEEIENYRNLRSDTQELEDIRGINPNEFIHLLSKSSNIAKVITSDVGNNQMWCAQSLELNINQLFLSSGGMGSMGYSIPAAIGSSISLNNACVLAISGDGGFQINIQELQTIVRNELPIKIVILNNKCLGMIRQFQDSYFNSCYQSTVWGYSAPDFIQIANAYGIDAYSIEKPTDIEKGLSELWKEPRKPFLLNVSIDIQTNVYPKIMYGSTLTNMEPIIKHIKK